MTTKQMLDKGMSSKEIIEASKSELAVNRERIDAKQAKVSEVAKMLNIELKKAASLIEQELKRVEASARYRKSDSYKLRLEQQKIVRRMLKA